MCTHIHISCMRSSRSRPTAETVSSLHFVQWFVITVTNMIHAGSSSHPKRQANYESEAKAEGKMLNCASCRRASDFTSLHRRHRLIIWIFLSLLQSLRCGSFVERIPRFFFLQQFLPIATVFADPMQFLSDTLLLLRIPEAPGLCTLPLHGPPPTVPISFS